MKRSSIQAFQSLLDEYRQLKSQLEKKHAVLQEMGRELQKLGILNGAATVPETTVQTKHAAVPRKGRKGEIKATALAVLKSDGPLGHKDIKARVEKKLGRKVANQYVLLDSMVRKKLLKKDKGIYSMA